jgi:hypothetical protein
VVTLLYVALKKNPGGHIHCVLLVVLSVGTWFAEGTCFTEAQSLTHAKSVELKMKPLLQKHVKLSTFVPLELVVALVQLS